MEKNGKKQEECFSGFWQNVFLSLLYLYPIAMASLLFLSVMKLLATAFMTGSKTLKRRENEAKVGKTDGG